MTEAARSLAADFVGLKRLWPYIAKDRRLVFFAIMLIPVISLLQTALPLILRRAVDKGVMGKDVEALATYAGLFLGAIGLEYLARASQSVAGSLAVHRMIRGLRLTMVRHVLGLKAGYHDRTLSGTLVTRATGDFDNLSESLNMGVLTSVVDIAVLLGCVVGMVILSWQLSLSALVILPIVWIIVQQFSKALKGAMLKARVKIAALNAYTQEAFYGHATLKLLTAEGDAQKRYEKLNVEFRDAQMGSVVLDAMMFAVLDGIASVTVGIVLWFAVRRVGLAEGVSAGVLVAFVAYIQQLFEPLKHLGNKMAMLQGAFTSIDRIYGVLTLKDSIGGSVPVPPLEGRIEFKNVSFSYDPAKGEKVLTDATFALEPGQSLAVVGATGSGKSTLVKLLAKLYDGYDGEIRLDGMDLATLDPVALRRRIAIVPQDIALFDGTIAANIGLGLPGVSREAVEAAAIAVGADHFIRRLPGGFDAEVKERGANLSHGERQLLAFARALARDPGLVILDEATSSVDPDSEAAIQEATERLLKGRTVIVIAHRLSTIRQCDRILVLSHGKVVECGTHSELLQRGQAYAALHQAMV